MNQQLPKQRELSELEKSGVIMSRLLHELTNHLSILVGGIQLIDACKDDPALTSASLAAITDAGKTIGEIVERYASFHRQLPYEAGAFGLQEILREIQAGLDDTFKGKAGAWILNPPSDMSGPACVEPRWVRYAVMEVIRLSHATSGRVSIYTPGMTFDGRGVRQPVILSPSKQFFHIEVNWSSEKPAFQETDLFKPVDLNLATLIGIVRWARGQVGYTHLGEKENRFWISLPLADRELGK